MCKSLQTAALSCLLTTLILPIIANAQTCKPESIPATAPSSRFTDNTDGTVTDKNTGLIWKKCSEGQTLNGSSCSGTATAYTWQQALQMVQTINSNGGFAGQTDWRLPNIKELSSIVERQCSDPAFNLAVFPDTSVTQFLSSSPNINTTSEDRLNVWSIDNYGSTIPILKDAPYQVRLVRNSQ